MDGHPSGSPRARRLRAKAVSHLRAHRLISTTLLTSERVSNGVRCRNPVVMAFVPFESASVFLARKMARSELFQRSFWNLIFSRMIGGLTARCGNGI
eukprot:scaffold2171_cov253-Pinguiococcus_pyrenoidosus.AAC.1